LLSSDRGAESPCVREDLQSSAPRTPVASLEILPAPPGWRACGLTGVPRSPRHGEH
jgi:hypothetical protein